MQVWTISVLLLLMAVFFAIAVATQVFVAGYLRPRSLFTSLLLGTLLSSVAALAIDIDVPG